MAEFYWVGTYVSEINGLTAFDFNWPGNWYMTETIITDCNAIGTGKAPGSPKLVPTARGIGFDNYDAATAIESGSLPTYSAICKTYKIATRAPGPGDDVFVGGEGWLSRTPLLFGGYQGGSTGGVWLNGADDPTSPTGYTHAYGTTYNSALNNVFIGGMYLGHPDFNYPWGRIGGGFTANVDKYSPWTDSANFAQSIWKGYFESDSTTTIQKRLPDGTIIYVDVNGGQFRSAGLTWSSGDITDRHLSLNIKANNIIESARTYTGIDLVVDFNISKNLQQYAEVNPDTSITYYDAANTVYTRISHNTVSFISGVVREIYNKSADNVYDWGGELFEDGIHDIYYMNRHERLILDGITAGYVRTYITDQLHMKNNTAVASLHIDDYFTYTANRVYCKHPGTKHHIEGIVDRSAVVTELGLTGTDAAENLDNKLYVHAQASSFIRTDGEDGYVNLYVGGDNSGVTAYVKELEIDVVRDEFTQDGVDGNPDWRPINLYFTGNAPIVIDYLTAKCCLVTTSNLTNTNYVSIGSGKFGQFTWFWPFKDGHSKWYFGTRDGATPSVFQGGIEYLQEGLTDNTNDHESVLQLSPVMRLYNPSIGTLSPALLRFKGTGITQITTRTPNAG